MWRQSDGFRATLGLAVILPLLLVKAVVAQEAPEIVVVDQEALFEESLLGQQITEELEERSAALAAENRAIEAELVAEESDLTERRETLDPAEFRALADAFDEKVERLRAAQDAKGRDLVALRDAERQRFTSAVGPILLDYMRDTGANIMFDSRSLVASSERVDVTQEIIAEIDARVGAEDAFGAVPEAEGSGPRAPETETAD